MNTRRKWSFDEKLAIIKEAKINGVTQTIRKHGLFGTTYYQWKRIFELDGENGLKNPYQRKNPELKKLQIENLRLKQLLAEKELALQIKGELLKKTLFRKQNT